MVGLGETHEEMVDAFAALREHGVQVLTVGQYLRPSERHLPVVRYWHPDEFAALERAAYELGFEPRRRRPARALLLPRRPARPAGARGRRPAGGEQLGGLKAVCARDAPPRGAHRAAPRRSRCCRRPLRSTDAMLARPTPRRGRRPRELAGVRV